MRFNADILDLQGKRIVTGAYLHSAVVRVSLLAPEGFAS